MKLLPLLRFCLTILTLAALPALAQPSPAPEKVRLQLKWFHQFQFAGYYAAIEQGFYAEEGLQVEIVERVLEKNFVKQVVSGESAYGVGDSGLLSEYAKGEPITALAAIFQHNPLVFFSRQESGIISPYEMAGKRVMSDMISANDAPLRAMLAATRITDKDYTLVPQVNDYSLLAQEKVDVISGYLTNQPFFFRQQGVKVNIINPQNYGIDFYGDMLFTSLHELLEKPERAERFKRASLKGWRYALDHPEELVQLIHGKYHSKLSVEHLRFEAAEARKLILPDVVPLGLIEPGRIKTMADAYATAGFNRPLSEAEVAGFIYAGKATGLVLTDQEKVWLATHPVIRVGIDRDFPPYEWVDKDGHYVGMAADYLRRLEKMLGVRFEIIKDKSWADVLEMAKRGQLDMMSCIVKTPERQQFLIFADEPYKASQSVIIDSGQGGFIGSLANLAGKRVAVEKGYFLQELLEKDHPKIQLVLAGDTQKALQLVIDGKADAYVGDAGSANYVIKKEGLLSLRFSGQTEYSSQHSVAVAKTSPELSSIINKAMAGFPREETDAIFSRWLGLRVEQGIKPETVLTYGAALVLLLLLFGYWNYRLRREIADRRAVEEKLRVGDLALKAISQGVLISDADGCLQSVNDAFLSITGFDKSEILGRTCGFVQGPLTDQGTVSVIRQARESVTEFSGEILNYRKDGSIFWNELTVAPVRDARGRLTHFIGITRDITQRKQAEAELLRSNAELEQFSYAISHDMRQPLRMISSYLQLLEMSLADRLDGENREYLSFAVDGAKRLDQMLVGLLDYSRVGRKGEPPAWIESRVLLDEALLFLQPAIAEAQAAVHIEGHWPSVLVSPDEMLRLLQNLIGNALKFRVAGRTPEVTVTSEVAGKLWRVSVADNGIGIIPGQIDRLFQVFQRLQSRADYEGTGIGLALCRKIAEHHGGSIRVESAGEGQGCQFYVELPQEGA